MEASMGKSKEYFVAFIINEDAKLIRLNKTGFSKLSDIDRFTTCFSDKSEFSKYLNDRSKHDINVNTDIFIFTIDDKIKFYNICLMKRTCDLQMLDEYTKHLSKKQMQMLYEAKVHQKYSHKLFESYEDMEDEETYELYIDDYIIEDLDITREDVIDSVRSMADNVKIMNKPEGISFKCNDTDTYENIIDAIELLGVEPEVLGSMLDEKYLRD